MIDKEKQPNITSEDVKAFSEGRLLVYPTESIMGIGCDPLNASAVNRLLELKCRPKSKGVILIASSYEQLQPFVDDRHLSSSQLSVMFTSWPGPNTWLVPKSNLAPEWITGEHEKIAVRVTNHSVARQLCESCNSPLVSTSANLSGDAPAKNQQEAYDYFGSAVHYVSGSVGQEAKPSTIRDSETGNIIRE